MHAKHGIGKGRKAGIRNKTKVERIIDAVVAAAGGSAEDTVTLLEEHYQTEQRREGRGQDPVRHEFLESNKLLPVYLQQFGLDNSGSREAMKNLYQYACNATPVGSFK